MLKKHFTASGGDVSNLNGLTLELQMPFNSIPTQIKKDGRKVRKKEKTVTEKSVFPDYPFSV